MFGLDWEHVPLKGGKGSFVNGGCKWKVENKILPYSTRAWVHQRQSEFNSKTLTESKRMPTHSALQGEGKDKPQLREQQR